MININSELTYDEIMFRLLEIRIRDQDDFNITGFVEITCHMIGCAEPVFSTSDLTTEIIKVISYISYCAATDVSQSAVRAINQEEENMMLKYEEAVSESGSDFVYEQMSRIGLRLHVRMAAVYIVAKDCLAVMKQEFYESVLNLRKRSR